MGVFSWAKEIITETGGGIEPIPIGLERNPGAIVELGAHNPPDVPLYMLRIGMRSGFGRSEAGLPVYRRENPSSHPILKEIYSCEVAGQHLEAANVFSLREKAQRALEAIAPARTLPLCYFRAPRFDYSLPVYEEGSELVCPPLTGPKIKASDLAGMREPVTRWLRSAGYLMDDEDPEVLVVRPSDLRLVPPAALVRCLDDDSIWLPTVEGTSPDGPVIGLLTHPAELAPERRILPGGDPESPPSGTDVTALLRLLGIEMARRGILVNPWTLYATKVRPEIWARTEELTDPTDRSLECYLEDGAPLSVDIRHTAAGEVVAAMEEDGINVFLAGDDTALTTIVGRHLVASGFLTHVEDVRIESARIAPAEQLDPDSIWTGEERSEVTELEGPQGPAHPVPEKTTDQEVPAS